MTSAICSLLAKLPFPDGQTVSLVDVGARWGANPPWNQLDGRYLSYLGFEPDEEECRSLIAQRASARIEYIPVGLSAGVEDQVLHLTREPGCSSIFPPNSSLLAKFFLSERWDVQRKVPIRTMPLARILDERRLSADALKVDVQGAALQVLQGAGNHLDRVLLIEVEVEFTEMYRGEPLFAAVDEFLRQRGFQLLDINKYYAKRRILGSRHASRGQVLFADVLYAVSVDKFYGSELHPAQMTERLWNLILMLCLYGHFDLALEFALHRSSPLTEHEKAVVGASIREHTAIPRWKLLLFDNSFCDKAGFILSLLANSLQVKSRRVGWGSDQSAVDSRYKYYLRRPILNPFRK